MSKPEIKIKIVETLLSINEIDWDACAAPEEADGKRPFDPFTTYRFYGHWRKVVLLESRLVGTLITYLLFVEMIY